MEETVKLELRMYGLVPYNISPIQQAIQFGHAVVEYGQMVRHVGVESLISQYNDWADNWKTFIILNGGTSNHSQNRYNVSNTPFIGSMENNLESLKSNSIACEAFYEPDLNDMLSGIVFIVDERVFNKDKYPDFNLNTMYGESNSSTKYDAFKELNSNPLNPQFPDYLHLVNGKDVRIEWDKWVESIGGEKNLFLRVFLKNFRLA